MGKSRPIIKQKNDLVPLLPSDLSQRQIPPYFSWDDYKTTLTVNRAWHQTFSNITWQQKLNLKFGISHQVLEQVFEVAQPAIKEAFYKTLFGKLNYLLQNSPNYISNIYFNAEDHLSLLACCSDNLTLFKLIPPEEYGLWLEVALYVGCNNIVKEIMKRQTNLTQQAFYLGKCVDLNFKLAKEEFKYSSTPTLFSLDQAIQSGDLTLLHFIKKNNGPKIDYVALKFAAQHGQLKIVRCLVDSPYHLIPDASILYEAMGSGNLELVLFLIDRFQLRPSKNSVDIAARSGNLCLVKFLLDSYIHVERPNLGTLHCAAQSGNLTLLQFIINSFLITPTIETLRYAAKSKNVAMVRFLLNPENNFNLLPDQSILHTATGSGNITLVRFLFDPKNNFNLKVNAYTLHSAISSGNVALVRLLVAPPYNLRPVEMSLYEAVSYGHYRMTHYLLDRNNKFLLSYVHIKCKNNLALKFNLLACESYLVQAILCLKFNGHDRALPLLAKARADSTKFFNNTMKFFVANQKILALSDATIEWLNSLDIVKEALENPADKPREKISKSHQLTG